MRALRFPRCESHAWGALLRRSSQNLRRMSVARTVESSQQCRDSALQPLQEIEQQLLDSIAAVQEYQKGHPHVFNLNKLTRRIRSDLLYIRHLTTQPLQELTQSRLQGCLNNLRGFKGEMTALQEAPGVVAVCKKFRVPQTAASSEEQWQQEQLDSDSSSSDGSEPDPSNAGAHTGTEEVISTGNSRQQQQQQSAGSSRGSSPRAAAAELLVEVDVVADEGLTWIEVKNQERFGLQSGHFLGGSHGKGLAEQVTQLLEVAAAPAHKRRGRSPQVVVFFPSGVDEEVAAALTALGAKVANGPGSLAPLCGVVGNNVTNLDVTTLCALVSEVTWRDPHCEALQAWASRTIHWKECLEAQQQRPLLSELETLVGQDRQLVVSCAAVSQFEILLQQFSGPLERQRWAQLVPQLRVYHCTAGCRRSSTHSSSNASHQACAVCGDNLVQSAGLGEQQQAPGVKQLDRAWFPLSGRLQELEKMSLLQQAVFSLGDALHALTLTANGSAVRAAAVQGVVLDVQQHRPVWLTGL